MSRVATVLHQDDGLVVLDVRCAASAGSYEEEVVAGFEIVLPLAGGLERRSQHTGVVDAAFGYTTHPGMGQAITHLSDGDRCVAVMPTEQTADELGLDVVDRARVMVDQRRLAAAMGESDPLAAGEAWLAVAAVAIVRPASTAWPRITPPRAAAVRRVREAIVADPGAPWTMRSLGAVAGYAPHHLSRIFRQATGLTPAGYRDRVRLGAVLALMRDGLPIADVAATLGFCDHAHLTRRAVAVLGAPPSALRARSSKRAR